MPVCTVVQVVSERRAVDDAKESLRQLVTEWGLSPESRRLVVESSNVARGLVLATQRGPCDLMITHSPLPLARRRARFASVRGDLLAHVPVPLWSWNAAVPLPMQPPSIAAVADWAAAPASALRTAAAVAGRTGGRLQVACRLSQMDDALMADASQDYMPTSLEMAASALEAVGVTALASPVLRVLGSGTRALHRWCMDVRPDLLVVATPDALTWRRQFDEALHKHAAVVLCVDDRSAASPFVAGLLANTTCLDDDHRCADRPQRREQTGCL